MFSVVSLNNYIVHEPFTGLSDVFLHDLRLIIVDYRQPTNTVRG